MAVPRVFVSSTCYDLSEIRDSLRSFIESLSYEVVLSERGDVFFHPDLHTHESCLREVDNCHLFVLVIGGRFGGQYVADRKKSIVNAEYQAARQCGIPVFSFVKRRVMEDYHVYEKNKSNKEIIGKIAFPSIEKHEYASDIFEFINYVQQSPVNNGIFPFDFARDIQDILSKQWAGMMCDFLMKRRLRTEQSITTGLVENLTLASKKTEELLESIYKHMDKEVAEKDIKRLDEEMEAKKFFQRAFRHFRIEKFKSKTIDELLAINPKLPFYKFLAETGDFTIHNHIQVLDTKIQAETKRYVDLVVNNETHMSIWIAGDLSTKDKETIEEWFRMFDAYRKLDKEEQRRRVLADFV